ncbi:STAS domain-containing protein [Rhodococcoides yunnanense]|uniref:STAS domain-containing protein n=1 Tax=Rhodococcoides yunnanense TaxID=278209 RepID=UPI000A03A978|nr:STAS domain-containing protein [Rhodococcus yunnanensis]
MTVTPQGLNGGRPTRTQPASSSSASSSSVSVAETGAIFSSAPAGEGALVVTVHGDIDMRSAPILADYVCSCVAEGQRVVFDLSDVGFFAIAGLQVFAALDDAVAEAGTSWCLVEGHPVYRLLEAANVVPAVRRFTSVASALG